MKNIFVCLICIILLFVGCTTDQRQETWPTYANRPTSATGTTEESYSVPTTGNPLLWKENPLLSSLPFFPSGAAWVEIETTAARGVALCSLEATSQQMQDYAQILLQAGFTQHQDSFLRQAGTKDGVVEHFRFVGTSENLLRVDMGYDIVNDMVENLDALTGQPVGEDPVWGCILSVTDLTAETYTIEADAVQATDTWSADTLRAQLPDPGTPYWYTRGPQIAFPYMDQLQAQAYVQKLQDAGFVYKQTQRWNGDFQYKAENAQGYCVMLHAAVYNPSIAQQKVSDPFARNRGTVLLLYAPGAYPGDLWDGIVYAERIPEPGTLAQDWGYTWTSLQHKISYKGMDFEGAKAYAQKLQQQLAQAPGAPKDISAPVVNEQDRTVLYEISITYAEARPDSTEIDYHLFAGCFSYDPKRGDCPAQMIY